MTSIKHATYGGYQKCRRTRYGACTPCKQAAADYARQRRQTKPEVRAADYMWSAAGYRALWRLSKRYPDEFEALRIEEMQKARAKDQQRQEGAAA